MLRAIGQKFIPKAFRSETPLAVRALEKFLPKENLKTLKVPDPKFPGPKISLGKIHIVKLDKEAGEALRVQGVAQSLHKKS